MWGQEDFARERQRRFLTHLRYWFPTSDMIWGYWHWFVFIPLRLAVGWVPVSVPAGLTRAMPMTRGVLTARVGTKFLQRWEAVANSLRGEKHVLAPDAVKNGLMPPLFRRCAIRVEATRLGELDYYLIYAQDDGGGLFCRRIIRPSAGFAYHEVAYADPSGSGSIAPELLASAIRVYLACGIREVRLDAGFNIGGLLWPKYGFRPITTDDWRGTHKRITRNFNKLPDDIRASIDSDVGSILAEDHPRAIWRFAKLNTYRVTIEGIGRKVGDCLLHRTRWRGTLNLDDPFAREILVQRLGPELGPAIEREVSLTRDH